MTGDLKHPSSSLIDDFLRVRLRNYKFHSRVHFLCAQVISCWHENEILSSCISISRWLETWDVRKWMREIATEFRVDELNDVQDCVEASLDELSSNIEHWTCKWNERRNVSTLAEESSIISFTCSPFLLFIANFPLPWGFHRCWNFYFRFSETFFALQWSNLSTRFSSKVIHLICQLSLNH